MTIHIHEDDWGLRCLHPMRAWSEARADLAKARAEEIARRAPEGAGWTDVHEIAAPAASFDAAGVTLDVLRAALAAHLPRVAQFNATASCGFGEGGHDAMGVYQTDPDCYGLSNSCFVKIDSEDGVVTSVWFERPDDEASLARLRAAFAAIEQAAPTFLIDYVRDAQGELADVAFLDAYFAPDAGG